MAKSIRLHPEHGLNPTMTTCFWCHEPTGDIALLGAAYKGEAPRNTIVNREPCEKCKAAWSLGMVVLEADDNPPHDPTGDWMVLTMDAARYLFSDQPNLDEMLQHRMIKIGPTQFQLWKAQAKDPAA